MGLSFIIKVPYILIFDEVRLTLPPVEDVSVRFPEVERVVLDPDMFPTLEILNPDIFKNPMLDNTMLPPVVEERTRLLFP
jgi:hypothetical protein